MLFDFRLDPLRTAVTERFGSNFFDLQAESFLKGRLSVPDGSLGIEGFVIHGKTYMYFPPFPALIRIPIELVTHEFDGRLTLLSMAVAWFVLAAMTAKLYWLVRRCVRGAVAVSRTESVYSAIFLAAATGGTVIVFDGSLPWVYHEVYLWATALAVGSLYWLIRVILSPTPRSITWLAGFTLATILTRTTGGWAVCFVVIAAGVWILTGRPHPDLRRIGWWVIAAGLVPLLAGASYNFVKFHHPYLFPLQDQVWTAVNAHRRAALAHNGGTITGPQFFLTSLVNYFRPDGIRFVNFFPYITLPAHPAPAYGGAFLDQTYRTGSVTSFMPLLLVLSLVGAGSTLRRRVSFETRALRLPLLGALIIGGGVMDYGYVTYRYTSEFVPFLIVGSTVGVALLSKVTQGRRLRLRLGAVVALSVLTAFSVFANMATGSMTAAQTKGGSELVQYVALQQRISAATGNPLRARITRSASLPTTAPTDELHIVGDCDGLYLGTGDAYQPWVTVQQRQRSVHIAIGLTGVHDAMVDLLTVRGVVPYGVALQTDGAGQRARFVVSDPTTTTPEPWFPISAGSSVNLMLRPHTDLGLIELYASPGGPAGLVPLTEFDADWISRITDIVPATPAPGSQNAAGVTLSYTWGPVPALCRKLAAVAGSRVGS